MQQTNQPTTTTTNHPPLKDGHTPGLPFMSHLHEHLPAVYLPLAFYAGTEVLGLLTHTMLRVSRV
jgi:hypothetical protein